MYGSLSNEAKIQRGLDLLGCPPSNFCKLAGIGKTRFADVLNGTGRCFSDEEATTILSFLERLFDLQVAVDEAARDPITGKAPHVPLNYARTEEIGNALATRLAHKICLEDGDHALDAAAERAVKAATG